LHSGKSCTNEQKAKWKNPEHAVPSAQQFSLEIAPQQESMAKITLQSTQSCKEKTTFYQRGYIKSPSEASEDRAVGI